MPPGPHRRGPRRPRPGRHLDARPRPRRRHRRHRQRGRRPAGPLRWTAGDDRQPHRHGAHGRSLRRQPRRPRRPGGARDPDRARHRDRAPVRRRLLHRRGGRPLPAGHARQPRLRGRHGHRGRPRHHRDRRRRRGRRARPHRLSGPVPVSRPGPACVRRTPHRAGAGPRGGGCHHRRRHRCAGHLLDRVHGDRPVQPRRHHADAPAPRRRLRRSGHRDPCAGTRDPDVLPAGRHGRPPRTGPRRRLPQG